MLDKLLSSSGGYGGKVYRVGVQLLVVGIGFGRINWRASVAEVPVAAASAHCQLPLPPQSRADKKTVVEMWGLTAFPPMSGLFSEIKSLDSSLTFFFLYAGARVKVMASWHAMAL